MVFWLFFRKKKIFEIKTYWHKEKENRNTNSNNKSITLGFYVCVLSLILELFNA